MPGNSFVCDESALPESSLIICSRNRPELLRDTVGSILSADDIPTELILIDQSDNPNAGLAELSTDRACAIRYVWTQTVGSSIARNSGIAIARHNILAFIDDDMWVKPTWYGALIRALIQGGHRSVVTGRVLAAAAEKKDGFVIAVHAWENPQTYEGRIGRDILASGHMAMYRSAFDEIGGFDVRLGPGSRFPGAEDNDYGFRLLEAGYRIIYVPNSVIYHRAWRTRHEYVPLFWKYGRGQGAFYAKHWTFDDHYVLRRLASDVFRYIRLLPERLLLRERTVLLGSTAFVLGIFLGAMQWFLSQEGRRE